jgi:hypothetical protein
VTLLVDRSICRYELDAQLHVAAVDQAWSLCGRERGARADSSPGSVGLFGPVSFLELTITPGAGGGFLITSTTVRSEERQPVSLLARDRPHSEARLSVCGWCKRVDIGARWCEVEEALTELRVFEHDPLPILSHGICPACDDAVNAQLAF